MISPDSYNGILKAVRKLLISLEIANIKFLIEKDRRMKKFFLVSAISLSGYGLMANEKPVEAGAVIYYKALDAEAYKVDWKMDNQCYIASSVYSSTCSFTVGEQGIEVVMNNPYVVESPEIQDDQTEIKVIKTLEKITFSTDVGSGMTNVTETTVKSYPDTPDKESSIESNELSNLASFEASKLQPYSGNGIVALPAASNLTNDGAIVDLGANGQGMILEGLASLEERSFSWNIEGNSLVLKLGAGTLGYQTLSSDGMVDVVVMESKEGDQTRLFTGVAGSVNQEIYGQPMDPQAIVGAWFWQEGESTFEYKISEGGEFALRGAPDADYQYGVWAIDTDKIVGDRYLSTETGMPLESFKDQLACAQGTLENCELFQSRWYKLLGFDEQGRILVLRYLDVIGDSGYKGHWVHVLRRAEAPAPMSFDKNSILAPFS